MNKKINLREYLKEQVRMRYKPRSIMKNFKDNELLFNSLEDGREIRLSKNEVILNKNLKLLKKHKHDISTMDLFDSPIIGPLIVKVFTIPFFWLLNGMGYFTSAYAIKKGYGRDIVSHRLITITLLTGIVLGYILGHLIPVR